MKHGLLSVLIAALAIGATPASSIEEAVAKIKPAVGVLYREVFVYDAHGRFLRVERGNAGTLTAIWSDETRSCAAITAHGLAKKDEILWTSYRTLEEFRINHEDPSFNIRDAATWKITRIVKQEVREVHRFTGRYGATFDGQTLLWDDVELIASRGGPGLWEDFAVFRVPVGKLPAVEFGTESMVRQSSPVFMVHSPIGILQSATQGFIARHIEEKMPTTGSGLPFVRPVFVLDIRMAPGSSGAFVYALRGNTGYAIGVLGGYFHIAAAGGGQLGSDFPNALGISVFKKFLQDEKVLERCRAQ